MVRIALSIFVLTISTIIVHGHKHNPFLPLKKVLPAFSGAGGVTQDTCTQYFSYEDCQQKDYRLKRSKTKDYKTCLRWDDPRVLLQNVNVYSHPDSGLQGHNHCRNPDNSKSPWCFYLTGANRVHWAHCEVFNGELYRGTMARTKSGKACLPWASIPKNRVNPTLFPDSGLISNYCRNPDDSATIWCYHKVNRVTSYGVRFTWEYCV